MYPAYIDAARTHARGRRVAREHAVEQPRAAEIARACELGLGLACEVEEKAYSRDAWEVGRVRVEWKRADGTHVREDLDTRGKLLRAIAAEVRRGPERDADGKPGNHPMYATPEQMFEEYVRQVAGMAGPAPGTGKKAEKAKAAGGGSSKKKRR